MYIPFVFEHILYTIDKYFSQLVAFCTNNFSFDAYGMLLSVYFQNCIIDTRVDGMDINRTGNFSVHFGTVKIKSVVSFCPESIEFTVDPLHHPHCCKRPSREAWMSSSGNRLLSLF